MSCMYNLHEQIVYDFEVASYFDERACAIKHLEHLNIGDVVIFDRGYFSYFMLYQIFEHKLNAVFRLQKCSGKQNKIAMFGNNDKVEETIEYYPSASIISELKKKGHNLNIKPFTIRLIKHKINNEIYVYATTLIGANYPTNCFGDLYHGRWGIEELYKISKHFIEVEDFHSQTERGVKHELYGHLLFINVARMFENSAKGMLPNNNKSNELNDINEHDSTPILNINPNNTFKINFKNCVAVVGRYLENLILAPAQLIDTWLNALIKSVSKVRQKIRHGRSYPRISYRPKNKWDKSRPGLLKQS